MPSVPAVSPDLIADVSAALAKRTSAEVRFSSGDRAIYASDLSHYRQVPIGVVIPRTIEDVVETVAICREFGLPILARGTGTSLAGQTCNAAVVIDFSKYLNSILEVNPEEQYAWVQPGVINDQLRTAAEAHGLTFAPDPATHAYCTIGGMIGNNSCGAHSVLGGKTSENIEELDLLLYDGTRLRVGPASDAEMDAIIAEGGRRGDIYRRLKLLRDAYAEEVRTRFPDIPRRVSGYNLDYLLPENGCNIARALVGSEGTCVLVLAAKTRLIKSPQHRVLLLVAYPDVFAAGDRAAPIAALHPIAIEGFDKTVIENTKLAGKTLPGLRLYPEGGAWLLVEFGADSDEDALAQGQNAQEWLQKHDTQHIATRLLVDFAEREDAMKVREAGLGASRVPGVLPETWEGWEDSAVPPARLGDYLRDIDRLLKKYGYFTTMYGHFGQGCVHMRMNFNLRTVAGVADYRAFVTEAAHLVVSYGGSLSGEHGDGQSRGELLPIMFGERMMEAFREFKRIWDPGGKMNPGKLIDAYPLDTNLRTGPDYKPKPVLTVFQFPDDGGSMAAATERCFGVGKCRTLDAGTMCPSFQATREEQHSTRGRARMLFEMLRGDVIDDGWRSHDVKHALDLCLACKGCKGDCPVSVDVATYKAEFLYHYYQHERRPVAAHSMGQIHRWAQLAELAPAAANLVSQTPGLRTLAKKAAGVTQRRDMPAFAPETFRAWFARREKAQPRVAKNGEAREVILWADTFNNSFTPHTAQAAVAVLEDAGFTVRVPRQKLCCGRPLFDWGLLDQAKSQLRDIMVALAPDIAAGTPIVALEPSCAATFRDEIVNLFPQEDAAHRLKKQVMLLPDFLLQNGYEPPKWSGKAPGGKALIHGHCHQKALWGMSSEQKLLQKMGFNAEVMDSGCCGLAGAFGYEAEHYDISMKIGERVLLPGVRRAAPDTVVVSDGFSCRQQIAHGTPRRAMHIAEVLAMALEGADAQRKRRYVEEGRVQPPSRSHFSLALLGAGALAAAGIAFATFRKK